MKIGTRLCVLRCHPNWQNKFARLCDVLSYVPHCNGCAPSATTCKGFRAALISPFTLRLSAAISPSATLWKTTCKATTLTRRFSMMCALYRAFDFLSIDFWKFPKKIFCVSDVYNRLSLWYNIGTKMFFAGEILNLWEEQRILVRNLKENSGKTSAANGNSISTSANREKIATFSKRNGLITK